MSLYCFCPVPAGIFLPMITFSFNPDKSSDLAAIAAELKTLVVSWNDAAEIQLLVPNEALVIPNNNGLEVDGTASLYSTIFYHFFLDMNFPLSTVEEKPIDLSSISLNHLTL